MTQVNYFSSEGMILNQVYTTTAPLLQRVAFATRPRADSNVNIAALPSQHGSSASLPFKSSTYREEVERKR